MDLDFGAGLITLFINNLKGILPLNRLSPFI